MKRLLAARSRRRDHRVLLALLTDADRLSGWPLARTAHVSAARVYAVLDRLEADRYVTGEWETRNDDQPRRRFYRLTPQGRHWALRELGLTPRQEATRGSVADD